MLEKWCNTIQNNIMKTNVFSKFQYQHMYRMMGCAHRNSDHSSSVAVTSLSSRMDKYFVCSLCSMNKKIYYRLLDNKTISVTEQKE